MRLCILKVHVSLTEVQQDTYKRRRDDQDDGSADRSISLHNQLIEATRLLAEKTKAIEEYTDEVKQLKHDVSRFSFFAST